MSASDNAIGVGQIHQAVAAIMAEVGGVAKSRTNKQQGYAYRGIADVSLACQLIMAKHGVHLTPHAIIQETTEEKTAKSGGALFYIRQRIQFRFYHSDGSYFQCETTGEAMDSGDKAAGKCMSYAMKYAMTQTFCIPESDPADTETESHEVVGKNTVPPQPLKAPADPLTNEEIITLSDLAKAAGFKARPDILPTLKEFGGGATALKELDRSHLGDVTAALQKLIAAKTKPTQAELDADVEEALPTVAHA